MSEIKEELKEKLNTIIDTMSDEEVYQLLDSLEDTSEEDEIAELIAIKGEIKKLTKMVYKSVELYSNSNEESEEESIDKRDIEPLINFHQFLINSKDSLQNLPKISFWKLREFRESFYAFEKGFSDIDILYTQLMEHFEIVATAREGMVFDPLIHEAIEIQKDNTKEDNIIVEVYHQGYKKSEEVVKYAQVKVNKKEN